MRENRPAATLGDDKLGITGIGVMRPGPNSRRLRGRGGGGRRGGPGRPQNFESSGPDVKVRGSAQQVVEKYLALAREAATAGNPVMAENYYQHAEHYYRVQNANNAAASNAGNQGVSAREQPDFQPDVPTNGGNGAYGVDAVAEPEIEPAAVVEAPVALEPAAEDERESATDAAPERPAPRRRKPRSRDNGSVKEPVEQPS